MEGFEVLMQLQRQDLRIRTIVITGGGCGDATDYLDIATRLGAFPVLAKSVSNQALMAVVNESPPLQGNDSTTLTVASTSDW